eukprot:2803051-Amphidinium_carterae.1
MGSYPCQFLSLQIECVMQMHAVTVVRSFLHSTLAKDPAAYLCVLFSDVLSTSKDLFAARINMSEKLSGRKENKAEKHKTTE